MAIVSIFLGKIAFAGTKISMLIALELYNVLHPDKIIPAKTRILTLGKIFILVSFEFQKLHPSGIQNFLVS
jgi:hypothetical protein